MVKSLDLYEDSIRVSVRQEELPKVRITPMNYLPDLLTQPILEAILFIQKNIWLF
jgi:hypothetical protein